MIYPQCFVVTLCLLLPAGLVPAAPILLAVCILLAAPCMRLRSSPNLIAFGLLVALVVFSYAINYSSFISQIPFMQENFGMQPAFLAEKTIVFGITTLLMIAVAFLLGKNSAAAPGGTMALLRTFWVCGIIVSVTTTVYWLAETGGVFSRYNFTPPLTSSQGLHIHALMITSIPALTCLVLGVGSLTDRRLQQISLVSAAISISTVMVRLGWISFAVCAGLAIALSLRGMPPRRRRSLIAKVVLASMAVLIAQGAIYGNTLLDTYSEAIDTSTVAGDADVADEGSLASRIALLLHAGSIFAEHPLIGIGQGFFPAFSSLPIVITGQLTWVTSPHNGLIMLLVEFGLAGMIIIAAFQWKTLQRLRVVHRYATCGASFALVCSALALFIPLFVLQLMANSSLLPPSGEHGAVQQACCLWLLFGAACHTSSEPLQGLLHIRMPAWR